jgi:hypothetical protein
MHAYWLACPWSTPRNCIIWESQFAYLDAEIARRWDPQMAAIYYDQMINTTSAGANGTPGRAEQQRERCRSLVSGQ